MNQKHGFHRVFTGNAFEHHTPAPRRRRALRALLVWIGKLSKQLERSSDGTV